MQAGQPDLTAPAASSLDRVAQRSCAGGGRTGR